jgi:hypothetical protein
LASHHSYHFQQLPERVQRQLTRTITSGNSWLRDEGSGMVQFYGKTGLMLAFLLCVFVGIVASDFGVPGEDWLWTGATASVPGYFLIMIPIVYLVCRLIRRFQLRRLLGFEPGQYLFADTMIDARKAQLTVIDMVQLTRVTATEHHTNDRYDHTDFLFFFPDAEPRLWKVGNRNRAQQFGAKYNALRDEAHAAVERRDMAALLRLDPFFEIRRKGWAVPELSPAPSTLAAKVWARPVIAAILLALLIAPVLYVARNSAADQVMYSAAKQAATEEAYAAYVHDGKFHVAEMRAALPRVAYKQATRKSSVTAMREVLNRYPNAGLNDDVAAQIHSLFQASFAKFKEKAVSSDPALLDTMERLLLVLEKRGNSKVGISFTRPTELELGKLDASIKASEARMGGQRIIPASAHFGNDSAAKREARIGAGMASAFKAIFPNDILDLYVAGPSGPIAPALDISYDIAPSGDVFVSDDKSRAFVGLVARFRAALKVDNTSAPWTFHVEVLPPDHFNVEYKIPPGSNLKQPPEGQVYAVMAERAFDALAVDMHRAFFRKDAPAVQKIAVAR